MPPTTLVQAALVGLAGQRQVKPGDRAGLDLSESNG
jgi:hypothetical protein